MKNLEVTDDFMKRGGTEMGCMSTSTDKSIIAHYAKSSHSLIFRINVTSFMSRGADISWLSVYPDEPEMYTHH